MANEAPIRALTSWLETLQRLAFPSVLRDEFRLLDGPFIVRANLSNGQLGLEFVHAVRPPAVWSSATVQLSGALDDAIAAERAIDAVCREKGWQSRDLDDFRVALAQCERKRPRPN